MKNALFREIHRFYFLLFPICFLRCSSVRVQDNKKKKHTHVTMGAVGETIYSKFEDSHDYWISP